MVVATTVTKEHGSGMNPLPDRIRDILFFLGIWFGNMVR